MPDAFAPAQMGSSAAPPNLGSGTGPLGESLSTKPVKVDGALILTRGYSPTAPPLAPTPNSLQLDRELIPGRSPQVGPRFIHCQLHRYVIGELRAH